MARIKYYYDTEKCKYERIETKIGDVILNILGFLSLVLLVSLVGIFLYPKFFPSLQLVAAEDENKVLREIVDNELAEIDIDLEELKERDLNIYRVITETDSMPEVLKSRKRTRNNYQALIKPGFSYEDLLLKKLDHIAVINEKIEIQRASYEIIMNQAEKKEQMLASIPAIQPVSNKELKRLASGFGWRTHPIYKVKKFHYGIDFSAPIGTPIYATGDGKILKVKSSPGGYGKQVEIDHGFGYVTKYAHMNQIDVKIGQKIKRGEPIGQVGNSGTSTGPHLHYEVIHNGKKVNPVHYFFNDLNSEQYEEILKLSSIENQSLS